MRGGPGTFKRRKAGRGTGNEAMMLVHENKADHALCTLTFIVRYCLHSGEQRSLIYWDPITL